MIHRILPVLLAASFSVSGGCKKKNTEGLGDGLGSGPPVSSVEQSLTVVSVSPASVAPGVSASVQVIGSGIQQGASLTVGGQRVGTAQFLNENVMSATLSPLGAGTYDVAVTNPSGESSTLRGGLRVGLQGASVSIDRQRCGRVVVYFDTDQAGIGSMARSRLDSVMDCYTQGAHVVNLTGHADERGTTDYNVSLGQRRAEAVREHLLRGGVQGARVAITSFGEEQPAERGASETSWAKNRRVELVIP